MCGIIGYLDKRGGHERPVGRTLLTMLQALSSRGPDSAGVAILGPPRLGWVLQLKLPERTDPGTATRQVLEALPTTTAVIGHQVIGAYLRLELEGAADAVALEARLVVRVPGLEVVSLGQRLEIVKQVGSPQQLEKTYHIARRVGSHGIGHTRLSTESRVDLSHSQPFWAHGVPDLATVHNGHITNYHKLRRQYEQRGYHFWTENDSEVIGVYLRDQLSRGRTVEEALRCSFDDFDGSYCYLAAWEDGLAYVKDCFGLNPLVVAETDDFVAIATEEIALRRALGHGFLAREPAPGTMRVWSVSHTLSTAS